MYHQGGIAYVYGPLSHTDVTSHVINNSKYKGVAITIKLHLQPAHISIFQLNQPENIRRHNPHKQQASQRTLLDKQRA